DGNGPLSPPVIKPGCRSPAWQGRRSENGSPHGWPQRLPAEVGPSRQRSAPKTAVYWVRPRRQSTTPWAYRPTLRQYGAILADTTVLSRPRESLYRLQANWLC